MTSKTMPTVEDGTATHDLSHHSLKTRITLGVLVIFLTIIWPLMFYFSQTASRNISHTVGQQQLSAASFVADTINQHLEDRLKSMESVAQGITPSILRNTDAMQALLEQRPVLQNHFNAGTFVTRTDGIAIADFPRTSKRIGLNVIERDFMIAALKEGKASVGRPILGKIKLGVPILSMAAPIRDARGKVIGAIVGVTDLSKPNFFDKITGIPYGEAGGYVLIDPKHRLVVTATDRSRIMQVLPPPGSNPLLDRFLDGSQTKPAILTNPIGEEVQAVAKWIPVAGWRLVVASPTSEIYGQLRDQQAHYFVVTIILTLLGSLLVWRMVSHQLKPMQDAAKLLMSMTENSQSMQVIPKTGKDEIGVLVGSFNRVLSNLQQNQQALMKSEFRWKFALEGSRDGVWDWNIPEGRVFFSPRWKEMLGFAEDEIGDSLDEWKKRVHPEDKADTLALVNICLDGTSRFYASEHRVLCKNGQYKWISDRGMVVERNPAGEPLRMIGTHSDITDRKQSELELARSQCLLRDSQSAANIGSFINTLAAGTFEGTAVLDEILGITESDPHTTEGWLKLIHPNFRQAISDAFSAAIRELTPFDAEYKIIRPSDGAERWVHGLGKFALDQQGNAVRLVGTVQDITDRKQREQQIQAYQLNLESMVAEQTRTLTEEKMFFEDLVNTQPFGVYRIRTKVPTEKSGWDADETPSFRLDMVSPFLRQQLGISADEIKALQRAGESNVSLIDEKIHPDDLDGFRRIRNKAIAAVRNFTWEGRMNLIGEVRWMRIDASPRPVGKEVAWTAVIQDITERRQQSSLIYRSVVEASTDAFVAIDEDDRILEWSPQAERLFGYSLAEVRGKLLTQTIIPSAYASEHNNRLREFIGAGHDGVGKRHRLQALKSDGSEITVELQIMALKIGEHWRFTSFIRDISAELETERQLVQAQKLEAIGHLTGGMAHDFNNILGIVIGNLDLLSQDIPDGEPRELIDAAMVAAQRGADVTKSLLALARRRNLVPKEVNINQLILENEPLLRQTAGKRVNLKLKSDAEYAYCTIDAGSFSNALLNIVINARDAMPVGGDLLVYAYSMTVERGNAKLPQLEPGTYVVVGVDDSGTGMTADVARQAFDPFFTTKGRSKGTGMGLAMVLNFAKQSSGTARISSTAGRGTSVQMLLPSRLSAGKKDQTEASPNARKGGLTKGNRRVLLVDDEAGLLKVCARWLRNLGYKVETAVAAQHAIDRLKQEHFDLMITDVVMPGELDGIALAHHAASQYPSMRILLASGYPENLSEETRTRWTLLEKPLTQTALTEAVDVVLGLNLNQENGKWL